MSSKILATPCFSIVALTVFIPCAFTMMAGLHSALDIFTEMGVLAGRGDQVYYLALVTFTLLLIFDLVLLAYTWFGKLALRDEPCCDNGCIGIVCGEAFSSALLLLFWGCIVILSVLLMVVPVVAVVIAASRYLCHLGEPGIAILLQLSQGLPGVALTNDTSVDISPPPPFPGNGSDPSGDGNATNATSPISSFFPPPFAPPSPPDAAGGGNGTAPSGPGPSLIPAYCETAEEQATRAVGMLLSCTPLVLLSQIMILTSASTVIYAYAYGKGGGKSSGRSGAHSSDITVTGFGGGSM
jgi:hypothetical protein